MGGIRQQFSSALNVRLAQFRIAFSAKFDHLMGTDAPLTRANFRQRGYLFLVNDALQECFEQRYATQRDLGARLTRLSVDEIRRMAPGMFLDDIVFGVLEPDDGYADPRAVPAGFRAGASAAGTGFVQAEVVEIPRRHDRTTAVVLDTGERIEAPIVVNAAGACCRACRRTRWLPDPSLANGFSGHGLMMAPATGKIVSELIRLGRSETFDISALRVTRFSTGELFWDDAMI